MSRANQGGYVALIAVLITGAVATAAAVGILDAATYRNKELLVEQQAVQARQLTEGCAEDALQVMYDNNAFTGTGTFVLSGNSCTYTVTSTGTTTRTIVAVGTAGNSTKKLSVYVTIGTTTISVTSWQETT